VLQYFVIRKFRGTCSSAEMLKKYMVRERLGTPVLLHSASNIVSASHSFKCQEVETATEKQKTAPPPSL